MADAMDVTRTATLALCKSRILQYKNSGFDKGRTVRRVHQQGYSEAAILILLVVKKGKIYLRMTRRSTNLNSHKGQVVFPGGKKDETDKSFIDTALREAHEEIGLPPENVDIVTILSHSWIRRNKVVPVFAVLRDEFEVSMNHFEVESVFDVPLEIFLDEQNQDLGQFNNFIYHQFYYTPMKSDILQGEENEVTIFGFTAGFCLTTAIIVLHRLPSFEIKDIGLKYDLQAYAEWLSSSSSDDKPLNDCHSKL